LLVIVELLVELLGAEELLGAAEHGTKVIELPNNISSYIASDASLIFESMS
jgi:alpha-amylase/alpha-mannosidase (GH57 family)